MHCEWTFRQAYMDYGLFHSDILRAWTICRRRTLSLDSIIWTITNAFRLCSIRPFVRQIWSPLRLTHVVYRHSFYLSISLGTCSRLHKLLHSGRHPRDLYDPPICVDDSHVTVYISFMCATELTDRRNKSIVDALDGHF
jgi:hypothetical protein